MLLKDHDIPAQARPLLDRTGSRDEPEHPSDESTIAGPPPSSTQLSPPQYYPSSHEPEPRRLFSYRSAELRAPQSTAHVSHQASSGNLTLSTILDLNVAMPPLLPFPQAHLTSATVKEQVNGHFVAERGRVDVRLGFVGKEPVLDCPDLEGEPPTSSSGLQATIDRERIKAVVQISDRINLECVSRLISSL